MEVNNSSSLCQKILTNNTSVAGTKEYTKIPFAFLFFFFFFDQTESCNLLFKLLFNSLASKKGFRLIEAILERSQASRK